MARPPDSAPAPPLAPPRADNRYSRFVAWVKVALPLAALTLLSTLFLFPGDSGRDVTEALDADELRALMQKRLLRAPTYTSVTDDGGALTVTAETATPRAADPDLFDVTDLAVALDAADGVRATLAAAGGLVDRQAEEGTFTGDVRVVTSEGWVLRTERLEAALDGSRAVSPVPVRIVGPGLTLDAGTMRAITPEGGPPAGHVTFTGGVRLVYDPAEADAGSATAAD
jgi:lipopolysaccharide export system protein LptC